MLNSLIAKEADQRDNNERCIGWDELFVHIQKYTKSCNQYKLIKFVRI